MRRSIMHALTPLLILRARIVIAQVPPPSLAPSHDNLNLKVKHVFFCNQGGWAHLCRPLWQK
jgi:hypothetical protein